MSTRINITVHGDDLVGRAAMEQIANRLKKIQEDQDRADREETKKKLREEYNERVRQFGSSALGDYNLDKVPGFRYRPDELAASRPPEEVKIDVVAWSIESGVEGGIETITYRVANAARTQTVELIFDIPLMSTNPLTTTETYEGDYYGFNGTRTITETGQFDLGFRDTSYYGFLPAGNGSVIFIAIHRRYFAQIDYQSTMFGVGSTEPAEPCDILRQIRYYTTTSTSLPVAYSMVKCALITQSGTKEITPSATLLANLEYSYPSPENWNTYQGELQKGENGVEGFQFQCQPVFPDFPIGVTPYFVTFEQRDIPEGKRSGRLYGLPQHYGMGDLTTDSHVNVDYWTPAEFGQLKPLSGVDYGTDGYALNLTNYQEFRSTFLTDTPKPDLYIDACLTPDSCTPEFETFFRTKEIPIDIYTQMDPAVFRSTGRRVSKPTLQPNESLSFFWDWGQPGFCRQQLLGLGFLEEDLTL